MMLAILVLPACSRQNSPPMSPELVVEYREVLQTSVPDVSPQNPPTVGALAPSQVRILLFEAAAHSPRLFEYVLKVRSDFDIKEIDPRSGHTLLHRAAGKGQIGSVRLLLARKADLHATDKAGRTALHEAASLPDAATAVLLLEQGARFDATDGEGITPLMLAAAVTLAERLLARPVMLEQADRAGRTVLHHAARERRYEVMGLLLQRGADVNARDSLGRTPMHYAAATGYGRSVELLLQHGANPRLHDQNGLAPRDVARMERHFHILDMITNWRREAAP